MLDRLRKQAFQILAATSTCTLSTTGPAGLQASNIIWGVDQDRLYMLVPDTSDHLFNLEHDKLVVLTATNWDLSGAAVKVDLTAAPFTAQQAAWCIVFEIIPQRMHFMSDQQARSTVDF